MDLNKVGIYTIVNINICTKTKLLIFQDIFGGETGGGYDEFDDFM